MDGDLFAGPAFGDLHRLPLADGALYLPGRALPVAEDFLALIAGLTRQAPLRHMATPGGRPMSVAMSNCGALGWVSDAHGYRYAPVDPLNGQPWPAMPGAFATLARDAAADAGFPDFRPDACLINRYVRGARMGLHQDRDEADLAAPIVSVSLGLPCVFLFGGLRRNDPVRRIPLAHGDVVVWGGAARLAFHGVAPLKPGPAAEVRYNLTFRKTR